MTDEMLALALANAEKAGAARNVEFLKGTVEAIPQPANTIDVVISNCVINLSTDKPAVFVRVLKPSGRIGVSDVVADDALPHRPAGRAWRLRGLVPVLRGVRCRPSGSRVGGLGEDLATPGDAVGTDPHVGPGDQATFLAARVPAERAAVRLLLPRAPAAERRPKGCAGR